MEMYEFFQKEEYFDELETEKGRNEIICSADRQEAMLEVEIRSWCVSQRIFAERFAGSEAAMRDVLHLFPIPLDRNLWAEDIAKHVMSLPEYMHIWLGHMRSMAIYFDTMELKYTFFFSLMNSYREFKYWQESNCSTSFAKEMAKEVDEEYLGILYEIGSEAIDKDEVQKRLIEDGSSQSYVDFINGIMRLFDVR